MDYSPENVPEPRKKHKKKHSSSSSFRPETFTASVSDTVQDEAVTSSADAMLPEKRKRKYRREAHSDGAAVEEEDQEDAQFASQLIDAALPAEMLVEPVEGEEVVKKKRKERTRQPKGEEAVLSDFVASTDEGEPLETPSLKKERKKKCNKVAEEAEISNDAEIKMEPVVDEAAPTKSRKGEEKRIAAAIPLENFESGAPKSAGMPKGILKNADSASETHLGAASKPDKKIKPTAPSPKPNPNGYVDPAIKYLRMWKSARPSWTFQKVRQVWLLRNWRDRLKMTDDDFLIFLDYIVDLKGGSRAKTVEEANCVRDEYEASETYGADDELKQKLYERAGKVVEVLSAVSE